MDQIIEELQAMEKKLDEVLNRLSRIEAAVMIPTQVATAAPATAPAAQQRQEPAREHTQRATSEYPVSTICTECGADIWIQWSRKKEKEYFTNGRTWDKQDGPSFHNHDRGR